MWLALVFAIASVAMPPTAPPLWSNFGSTRSRGRKFGVEELETFSDRTRWRSWCHCILVRSAESIGKSLMAIGLSLPRCPKAGRLR